MEAQENGPSGCLRSKARNSLSHGLLSPDCAFDFQPEVLILE